MLRLNSDFPSNFNPITSVHPLPRKYFSSIFQNLTSHFPKYVFLSPHLASLGGTARDRHGRWRQDAVDVKLCCALRRADESSFADEQKRVVLAPLGWC